MEKLASIDTCSSSCMDAASGSPSATRAIIISEIIPREDGTQRRIRSALTGSVNFKKLRVSAVNSVDAERDGTGGSSWCAAE